jgi:hypothetical protein
MLANLFIVLACLAILSVGTSETARDRAQSMLSKMSLEEKVVMLHGSIEASEYIGFVEGNKRLGIKDIRMNDGPQGFRSPSNPGSTTAWVCVRMTWYHHTPQFR